MRQISRLVLVSCFVSMVSTLSVHAQAAGNGGRWIASLAEPGQGLSVRDVSRHTGLPTFATSPGKGILLQTEPGASAEERALAFIDNYGRQFGLSNRSQVRTIRTERDELGFEHVRMLQVHRGVPVTGGEFIVHLKGSHAVAANGRTVAELPDDVLPTISPEGAKATARDVIRKYRAADAPTAAYSEPRLEILNRAFLTDSGTDRARLAWFVEATGLALRQYIWIDAHTGALLLNFSQLADAKNRRIHTSNNTSVLPGAIVRTEGGAATGDADSDNAYTYSGITYDYFLTNFGRDSFDGAGAMMISTTHYCSDDTCPGDFGNAFWNGTQMVYGNGYASADDVVGHELAHAVTERTAGLFYYQQSGALNESFSDIFGEAIDLGSAVGGGNDTAGARWYMGEDLPIGAIRNMMDPNLYQNPSKMTDATFFWCSTTGWTDPSQDSGGVHINSGVPNHAFALMVDGGVFNGKSVVPVGMTKAAKIQYRALSTYLVSGSNFIDDYNALNQSCTDLIGTAGITASDCTQVKNALEAVEMHLTWGCNGATQAPALCTAGTPSFVFSDGFESGIGSWTSSNTAPTNTAGGWVGDISFAKSGLRMVYGNDPAVQSIHTLTMSNAVVVPAGGRMYFDHLFEFENGGANYDGGRFEYSINNGTTWIDANSLIDGGHAYDGILESTNPFGGVPAFIGASYGYVGTRLNLAGLAGQSIKFRFRIGSDELVGSLGWLLDNVGIYSCVVEQPPAPFTDDPIFIGQTAIKAVHLTELRTRINAIRVAKGLSQAVWTNAIAPGVPVRAIDIMELRTALIAAYTAAGMTPPTFTDSLSSIVWIKEYHIGQLRNAVLAIE
jgi:bacillolysin